MEPETKTPYPGSRPRWQRHYDAAVRLLDEAETTTGERRMSMHWQAQIHATLAQAEAVSFAVTAFRFDHRPAA